MTTSATVSASTAARETLEPFVELKFPVRGTQLPADHNYGLYAALVHQIPELRQQHDISILTIPGFGDKQGKISLTSDSCIRIRVPISKIPLAYQLAGKPIAIGKHPINIGIPQVSVLHPSANLRARIVTIKGYMQSEPFLAAARRQLSNLDISAKISIPADRSGNPSRKTLKIKRYTIVGFTTEISGLSDEDSIQLQRCGLGGKRHMGCGIFLPCKEDRDV
ncbi:type I-MYXAN CRISPR-associated protein Cas6/Cmx6 [Lusitaniella coriacea]|uniref:type I-MYXAN CRISPR-associated protein Cas6/Cmx6 n=1 Tax=Lusitaniella coriacea TaxID=1983105 RepID=UPI003CE73290